MIIDKERKVPLGRPLNSDDAELEAAATISARDIENAKQFWRRYAPRKYRKLLDAEPMKADGS